MSRRVWDLVRSEVPLVDQVGIDEAYLDITDLVAPKAFLRTLLGRIHAETGLTASVGIGPNKLIAKVASGCEKPRGMVALSREMACERFAGSPPSLIPGIGPKTAARLHEMGITTIAALREADEAALVERFGSNLGRFLLRRANFEDDGRVQTQRTVVSQSNERTFDEDISDRAELETILLPLERTPLRVAAAQGARGADDRDQGPARGLHDGDPCADDRSSDGGPGGGRRDRGGAAARLRPAAARAASGCASRFASREDAAQEPSAQLDLAV